MMMMMNLWLRIEWVIFRHKYRSSDLSNRRTSFIMGLDDLYGVSIGSAVFLGMQSEWITGKLLWVMNVERL